MATIFATRVLVSGNHHRFEHGEESNGGDADDDSDAGDGSSRAGVGRTGPVVYPLLGSDAPLSFWGGIDERTGVIIDTSHPLHGYNVRDTILCLPSGRGSCTASQVLLELILNGRAPRALVLRDRDGLVCVGALIAQSVFPEAKVLDVLQVTPDGGHELQTGSGGAPPRSNFDSLLDGQRRVGCVLSDGRLIVGASREDIERSLMIDSNGTVTSDETRASVDDLILSAEEEAMVDKATTNAERRAVDCLVRYARIVMDEPSYVPVEKAHIDGCTYIGPGGLHFVQRLVQDGGRVKVPTSLNSVSTDLRNWERLGILPTDSQQNSVALADAYVELGCSGDTFTCAPYLLDGPPRLGQHIVWGESNAVVFANSVLGARTEKYADYLDICCALVGQVPAVGVHVGEYRTPRVLLDMTGIELDPHDADSFSLLFPVLGHLCGSLSDGEVPLLVGLEQYAGMITRDHLKAFCAAFGTTAASPLIHISGITPEATSPSDVSAMIASCSKRQQRITLEALDETFRLLDQQDVSDDAETKASDDSIDWIAMGNPHLSLTECDELLRLVKREVPDGRRKHEDVSVMACISRALYDKSPSVPKLEAFGVTFVRDTCWCMLLDPPMIPSDAAATILTNSGKYAHYGPGLTGRNFRLGSLKDCVHAAWTSTLPRRPPRLDVPWRIGVRSFSTSVPPWSGRAASPHRTSPTTPLAWYHTTVRAAIRFLK